MKVIHNFAQEVVCSKVQEAYGSNHWVQGDKIIKRFPTYPYPKQVGYWFIRDNDLYLVVNDDK